MLLLHYPVNTFEVTLQENRLARMVINYKLAQKPELPEPQIPHKTDFVRGTNAIYIDLDELKTL